MMDIRQVSLAVVIPVFCCLTQGTLCSEVAELVDRNSPADIPEKLHDAQHGVKMGVINPACDDAKVNISVDFFDQPEEFICYHPKATLPFPSMRNLPPKKSCDTLLYNYRPRHYCMNYRIRYTTKIPTHEGHRPLWPVFGEYEYVPPQRWLHNVEHGAIVMLYHPCTHPVFVGQLRRIVTGCIRKHIITPYANLSLDRPLALVAWGCRFEMSSVDRKEIVEFIKEHALKGPEGHYTKEGQYTHRLIKVGKPPKGSYMNDTVLCPHY